jgi:hypothetical protein
LKQQIYYHKKNSNLDVQEYEFDKISHAIDFLHFLSPLAEFPSKTVYLFATETDVLIDENSTITKESIFISESILELIMLITLGYKAFTRLFIFEYDSYEDAYKNAIDMKSGKHLGLS